MASLRELCMVGTYEDYDVYGYLGVIEKDGRLVILNDKGGYISADPAQAKIAETKKQVALKQGSYTIQ